MLYRCGTLLGALGATLLLASCISGGAPPSAELGPKPPLEPLTFMAGFQPQANLPFLAAYVAQEKGLFRDQGLEVAIQHSGGQGEHYRLLATKRIQFTTAPAEDVLKQVAEQDLPFVAVALFGQRGDRAFAVLKRSGIANPKDWEGKTFGYKVFPPPDYLALLRAAGVDRAKIKEVPVGFDPRLLTEGKVDIYQVFRSNEPYLIQKLGFEVTVFAAADYGVPTLGLTYITHRDYLKENPCLVERFVKATLKGLAYAFDHEEEALDILLKYASQADREHQRAMLHIEKEAAITPLTQEKGLGWMTEAQWQALHDSLREFGALGRPVEVRRAFDDSLLQRVYRGGKLPWP